MKLHLPPAVCAGKLAHTNREFIHKICIFESWKNTAHPPIIGALGHSTDCIVKQPKTATIKIDLYSYSPVLCCHKRNSGLSCRSCMYKQSSTFALEYLKFV